MTKSILISIKPKYVAKILNGEKTIDVRKSMPKCNLPIDVYIYCTKAKKKNDYLIPAGAKWEKKNDCSGKVVAKFTVRKVEKWDIWQEDLEEKIKCACLSIKEFDDYSKGQVAYAWHISNLIIFDKPKELSEFYPYCKDEKCEYRKNHCSICYRIPLTKAPQSWCYVEVE